MSLPLWMCSTIFSMKTLLYVLPYATKFAIDPEQICLSYLAYLANSCVNGIEEVKFVKNNHVRTNRKIGIHLEAADSS